MVINDQSKYSIPNPFQPLLIRVHSAAHAFLGIIEKDGDLVPFDLEISDTVHRSYNLSERCFEKKELALQVKFVFQTLRCLAQFLLQREFSHISERAVQVADVGEFGVVRDENYLREWVVSADFLGKRKPVKTGHSDIEEKRVKEFTGAVLKQTFPVRVALYLALVGVKLPQLFRNQISHFPLVIAHRKLHQTAPAPPKSRPFFRILQQSSTKFKKVEF